MNFSSLPLNPLNMLASNALWQGVPLTYNLQCEEPSLLVLKQATTDFN